MHVRFVPIRQKLQVCPNPPHPSDAITLLTRGSDKYRGFRRTLRCLAIHSTVARPRGDGRDPVHLRPLC
jgi:hypothetical protein